MNARRKSLAEIKAQIEADHHQAELHQYKAGQLLEIFNGSPQLIRVYGRDIEYPNQPVLFAHDITMDDISKELKKEFQTLIEHLCHYHQNKAHNLQASIEKNAIPAK